MDPCDGELWPCHSSITRRTKLANATERKYNGIICTVTHGHTKTLAWRWGGEGEKLINLMWIWKCLRYFASCTKSLNIINSVSFFHFNYLCLAIFAPLRSKHFEKLTSALAWIFHFHSHCTGVVIFHPSSFQFALHIAKIHFELKF